MPTLTILSTKAPFTAVPANMVSAATLHVVSWTSQHLEDPGSNLGWISMSFLPINNFAINISPHSFSLRQAKHFEQLSFWRSSGTGAEDTWYSFFVPEEEMFPVSLWRVSDSSCRLAADTQFTGTAAKSTSVFKMASALGPTTKKIQPENWTMSVDIYYLSSAPIPELQWLSL